MKDVKSKAKDVSAEEKIKEAARRLFTQKGYAAVKTRDIAQEAGINLALLNYYFRSKQKLFELIMHENMAAFKQGIAELFANEKMDLYVKIERLAVYYIDTFLANPDLPLFIVNEMNSTHNTFFENGKDSNIESSKKVLIGQIEKMVKEGKMAPIHPMHIIANLMGMIIMPFLAKPMLLKRLSVSNTQYTALINERKKLIPIWVKTIFQPV